MHVCNNWRRQIDSTKNPVNFSSCLIYAVSKYFLLKKRFWHRCFPVNFVKFPRTPFFTENLRRLLLTTGISDRKNSIVEGPHITLVRLLILFSPLLQVSSLAFQFCTNSIIIISFFGYVRSVVALLFILRLYLFNRPIFWKLVPKSMLSNKHCSVTRKRFLFRDKKMIATRFYYDC